MSNVEQLPVKAPDDGPAVTLLGTDLPESYLDEAEPSPWMLSASLWSRRLKRFIQLAAILLVLGFYPALIIGSHVINDDPVSLSSERPWTSPEAGTMITIIGREIEGPGWSADRPGWHPQARLTGLPAWQESLSTSMSEYARMMAENATNQRGSPDPDLSAAARLLSIDPQLPQTPRLSAAAEALARYEGRLERGLASRTGGLDGLLDKLALLASWSDWSTMELSDQIGTRDGWPASKADIRAFYTARARAQLASQLLTASLSAEPDLVVTDAVQDRIDRLDAAWRRAATLDPVFVSNQTGDAHIMADHLAMMAFYIGEAGAETRELGGALIMQERGGGTDLIAEAATAPDTASASAD